MSESSQPPKPSPEVEQLVIMGQLDQAASLYAKQAGVDRRTAVEIVSSLEDD